jgi:hypothetical protein
MRWRQVDDDEPAERGEEEANCRIHDAIEELLETPLRMRALLHGPGHKNDSFCTSGRDCAGDGLNGGVGHRTDDRTQTNPKLHLIKISGPPILYRDVVWVAHISVYM